LKRRRFIQAGLFFCFASTLRARQADVDLDALSRSAEAWARENLDQDVLRALESGDRKQIEGVLKDLRRSFQGEYVLDIAALKDSVHAVLPLLEQYEETLPYALWLRSRLDELDVADELNKRTPAPRPKPGKPPLHAPNPAPDEVREIWIKKLANRSWPKTAQPFVKRLKPVFAAEHVPEQLVWIAEVESSFDPRARSPEGASGLFQLMPETARRYGLRTWPLDQRVKPELSARAAAKYLHSLHQHYHDWPLALAAYNAGEGRVDKQLARYKTHTYATIARHLPAETQLYVPRIEVTLLKRERIKLEDLQEP
jgi:membrane-bound lytic murein transglycosylase D